MVKAYVYTAESVAEPHDSSMKRRNHFVTLSLAIWRSCTQVWFIFQKFKAQLQQTRNQWSLYQQVGTCFLESAFQCQCFLHLVLIKFDLAVCHCQVLIFLHLVRECFSGASQMLMIWLVSLLEFTEYHAKAVAKEGVHQQKRSVPNY